jgi:DNA-binding MarR family transcriptional regulator
VPPHSHPSVPGPSAAIGEPVVRGCTCHKLRSLTRRVTAVYDRALAGVGLRVTQYSLLSHLERSTRDAGTPAGRPVAQLAAALDLDRTTLTRNLKPLIASGWIELCACDSDARQRLVCITDEGRAVLATARAHWRRAQTEVVTTIGAANAAQLHDMLDEYLPRFRQPVETEQAPE